MTRPPVSAVAAYVGAALHAERGDRADGGFLMQGDVRGDIQAAIDRAAGSVPSQAVPAAGDPLIERYWKEPKPSSPAPLALVPPGDRSDPAAGVGIASAASAGFVEKPHARFLMTSSERPKAECADDHRRFVPVEDSSPDDLVIDAVRQEMAKP